MSHRNKFNETFLWIIYSSNSHEDSLEILNGVRMQWDSEVFLAARDLGENADGAVKVSEVYRVKFDDLHPICIFHIPPGLTAHDMLTNLVDSSVSASAIQYTLLTGIAKRVNATLILRRTTSWSQVAVGPNDTWVGTIAILNASLADVSVTPLKITQGRLAVVKPTPFTWQPQYGFVFRHPRAVSVRAVYLQPFDNTLWLCTLCLLIILWISLVVSLKLTTESGSSTIAFAFLGIFGAFFQQGLEARIPTTSARILFALCLVFSFLCYQYYSTFIVASLITDPPKTIRTVEHLAASKLRIGAIDAPYNDDLFNSSNEAVKKIYAERVKKQNNFFEPSKGVKMIKEGGFAFHFDVESIYEEVVKTFTESEICDLQVSAFSFFIGYTNRSYEKQITFLRVIDTCAFVRKTSPYHQLISVLTMKLIEGGVVQNERIKWFASRPKCYSSRVDVVPVDIEQVITPIIIILFALVVSVLILTAEIYTKRRTMREKSHRKSVSQFNAHQERKIKKNKKLSHK
ncbi:glutamate receptor ionotropic, delta-2-like [Phlebotomus papatasi]|uniref:glutamate receptor ionotropic, delta-2-like n=1 Tax=Phlebotomus papatasi TaxID=29031 RepID=UPI0024839383|nr:glutamate receptor ionotropic, delta-2-like [Phlebotomus papatasi]